MTFKINKGGMKTMTFKINYDRWLIMIYFIFITIFINNHIYALPQRQFLQNYNTFNYGKNNNLINNTEQDKESVELKKENHQLKKENHQLKKENHQLKQKILKLKNKTLKNQQTTFKRKLKKNKLKSLFAKIFRCFNCLLETSSNGVELVNELQNLVDEF